MMLHFSDELKKAKGVLRERNANEMSRQVREKTSVSGETKRTVTEQLAESRLGGHTTSLMMFATSSVQLAADNQREDSRGRHHQQQQQHRHHGGPQQPSKENLRIPETLLKKRWSPRRWMADLGCSHRSSSSCQTTSQTSPARRNEHGERLLADDEQYARQFRGLPLSRILMVGSHDAGTKGITPASHYSPDAPKTLRNKETSTSTRNSTILGSIAKKISVKWAVSQSLSIYEQLCQGVRYFDIRVAPFVEKATTTRLIPEENVSFVNGEKRTLKIVHSLFGPTLSEVVGDVVRFLEENSYDSENEEMEGHASSGDSLSSGGRVVDQCSSTTPPDVTASVTCFPHEVLIFDIQHTIGFRRIHLPAQPPGTRKSEDDAACHQQCKFKQYDDYELLREELKPLAPYCIDRKVVPKPFDATLSELWSRGGAKKQQLQGKRRMFSVLVCCAGLDPSAFETLNEENTFKTGGHHSKGYPPSCCSVYHRKEVLSSIWPNRRTPTALLDELHNIAERDVKTIVKDRLASAPLPKHDDDDGEEEELIDYYEQCAKCSPVNDGSGVGADVNSKRTVEMMRRTKRTHHHTRKFCVTQAVMTPVGSDVAKGVLSPISTTDSLRGFANKVNSIALRWFLNWNALLLSTKTRTPCRMYMASEPNTVGNDSDHPVECPHVGDEGGDSRQHHHPSHQSSSWHTHRGPVQPYSQQQQHHPQFHVRLNALSTFKTFMYHHSRRKHAIRKAFHEVFGGLDEQRQQQQQQQINQKPKEMVGCVSMYHDPQTGTEYFGDRIGELSTQAGINTRTHPSPPPDVPELKVQSPTSSSSSSSFCWRCHTNIHSNIVMLDYVELGIVDMCVQVVVGDALTRDGEAGSGGEGGGGAQVPSNVTGTKVVKLSKLSALEVMILLNLLQL